MRDHERLDHHTGPSKENRVTSGSQRGPCQARQNFIPEPDSGRRHNQPDGVCDDQGNLPLPLPRCEPGDAHDAPGFSSPGGKDRPSGRMQRHGQQGRKAKGYNQTTFQKR